MKNEAEQLIVNGKHYPMWSQFIENKNDYLGGILVDDGDSFDKLLGLSCEESGTKIKDIKLEPNGTDSAYFSVIGEEYSCGFDVEYGGLVAGKDGWVTFSGYGGHEWRIKKPQLQNS